MATADPLLQPNPQSLQRLKHPRPKVRAADRHGAATVDVEAAVAVAAAVEASSRVRTLPKGNQVSRTNLASRISPRVSSRRRVQFLVPSKQFSVAMVLNSMMKPSKSARAASVRVVLSGAT